MENNMTKKDTTVFFIWLIEELVMRLFYKQFLCRSTTICKLDTN